MTDATFAWEKKKDPVLHGVSLNVQKGQLVIIVGQVGVGKSSLLQVWVKAEQRGQGRRQEGCKEVQSVSDFRASMQTNKN